jgi:hypothetical protein
MTKPLRRRHLQVWTLLAVAIPAGIISAYIAAPKEVINKLLPGEKTAALPVVINKVETKNYSAYLRRSADKKNYQLQWTNKNTLTQPSSLIYKVSPGLPVNRDWLFKAGTSETAELIGRIGSAGTYFFPLKAHPENTYHFIVYDIIHQHITDSLNFK